MMLGVPWLKTLGPHITDYDKLSIKFYSHNFESVSVPPLPSFEQMVLILLRQHSIFSKLSKCFFGKTQMDYWTRLSLVRVWRWMAPKFKLSLIGPFPLTSRNFVVSSDCPAITVALSRKFESLGSLLSQIIESWISSNNHSLIPNFPIY